MAFKGDDEGSQRGNEPDKSVNQQCEINVSHGFSPQSVRLDWRDVREAKASLTNTTRKAANAPGNAGEPAQRKRTALRVVRNRLGIAHDHAEGGKGDLTMQQLD
jgi:hypothetical protein